MNLLSSWAQKLVYLAIFATIIELLLPNGEIRRYIKMVMGLVFVLAILSPLFNLLKGNDWLEPLLFAQPSALDNAENANSAIAAGVLLREQALTTLTDEVQQEVAREATALILAMADVKKAQVNLEDNRPLVSVQAVTGANIVLLTDKVRHLAATYLGVGSSDIDVLVEPWHE